MCGRSWDPSDSEARRGPSGLKDWQQGARWEARESSSGRSKSTTKTLRWEHTRHVRRAGPTVSEENETGMGGGEGAGEVGRGHAEDRAGVQRVQIQWTISSEGLRAEV